MHLSLLIYLRIRRYWFYWDYLLDIRLFLLPSTYLFLPLDIVHSQLVLVPVSIIFCLTKIWLHLFSGTFFSSSDLSFHSFAISLVRADKQRSAFEVYYVDICSRISAYVIGNKRCMLSAVSLEDWVRLFYLMPWSFSPFSFWACRHFGMVRFYCERYLRETLYSCNSSQTTSWRSHRTSWRVTPSGLG